MTEEDKRNLAHYRLSAAKEMLDSSKRELKASLKTSVNRSYYAIFHAIRALLAIDGKDFKKHSAVLGDFNKCYVKTGIFDVNTATVARNAFNVRNESDYEDFYIVSREQAVEQLNDAEKFVETIVEYLKMK